LFCRLAALFARFRSMRDMRIASRQNSWVIL
jgi:hypothetical protein